MHWRSHEPAIATLLLIARADMISYSLSFSVIKTQTLLLNFLFPKATFFIPLSSHLVCVFFGAGMFLYGTSQKGFCCQCLRESALNFWHHFLSCLLQTSYVTGRSVKTSTPHLDSIFKRDREKHDVYCATRYTIHKDNLFAEVFGDG